MKRYQFRLEAVLRVRRLEEEAQRAGLRRSGAARDAAERAEEQAQDHYRRAPQTLGESSVTEFRAQRTGALRAAQEAGLRHADARRAQADLDEARRRWTHAAGQVSVLERLDERRRAEYRSEIERLENLAVEELSSARAVRAAQEEAGASAAGPADGNVAGAAGGDGR